MSREEMACDYVMSLVAEVESRVMNAHTMTWADKLKFVELMLMCDSNVVYVPEGLDSCLSDKEKRW